MTPSEWLLKKFDREMAKIRRDGSSGYRDVWVRPIFSFHEIDIGGARYRYRPGDTTIYDDPEEDE